MFSGRYWSLTEVEGIRYTYRESLLAPIFSISLTFFVSRLIFVSFYTIWGITSGPFWHHVGSIVTSFWHHVRSVEDHSGNIQGSFWNYSGITLGSFSDHPRIISDMISGSSGIILELFLYYVHTQGPQRLYENDRKGLHGNLLKASSVLFWQHEEIWPQMNRVGPFDQ